ncbi:MAG: glycosyltransferase family 2 protein, partial [Clostridia bacterium]|nr:glycosyltransferase family 2 protein [Clostridia bacterium]
MMKIRNIGFLLNMNLIFDIITHEEYNVLARSIMVENQNAKIFVIIPVYNCERYLKECINSILNQPYKNLEAVVINDGSKDSSLAIAEEIAQVNKRVHVINQLNQGVSAARNNGIDYAIENNAKFIAFLDSDDIWTDNFCTNELINELVDQDADVVHFSFFRGNETLTKGKAVRVENKISTGKDISFWGNDSFCASIVKASLLDSNNIRFPQGIDYNEDVVFKYICLALSNKVIYKDHFSFIYRSNSSSSSH